MTDKAQKVLQKMKRRQTLFPSPKRGDRVLGEFNVSALNSVGPL